jgi:putative restriction endonuclease
MATGVFTTMVNPAYDDLPEVRYHFPKTYLNQARETVGDWISIASHVVRMPTLTKRDT